MLFKEKNVFKITNYWLFNTTCKKKKSHDHVGVGASLRESNSAGFILRQRGVNRAVVFFVSER